MTEGGGPGGGLVLEMRGVSKRFGATLALRGVDLAVRRGEVHALIGENGAGKSTLMKVLSGAHPPGGGSMLLEGKPYSPAGPDAARRAGVSMIYQELTLAPRLTVEENVFLGRESSSFGITRRAAQEERTGAALALLGHADIAPRAVVSSLGQGARQVVEIARAIVSDARLLVLDEPTSSLTRRDAERLFDVIATLRERGVSFIYISHFLEEVERVAERFTVLREGLTVGTGEVRTTRMEQVIEMMVGRTLRDLFPGVPHERGEAVLALESLHGERLPRGADLTLHRGEILGIAGLVGAGRTEMLRAVYGLDPVRSGRIVVGSLEGGHATPAARMGQGIGFLSEDRKEEGLALGRTVAENVTLSALGSISRMGWIVPSLERREVGRWIDRLRIRCRSPADPVSALSGGNQQKTAIARLLHQRADVLLLDEPTRGIDIGSKVEVYRLMGELAAEGKAILFVSSYLPELLGVADRIAVMSRGRLSEARPASAWSEKSILACATGGEAA
ncbi:MAG TPA: sugar ABC transporter ATP-binding protein [Planctomycetota bacterium]|nr:sugar ABC transporter ATP-binding protein [Planctomycetota bacterium]